MSDIHDLRREAIPYATPLTNSESAFPKWALNFIRFLPPVFETNLIKVRVFVILVMS